MFEANKGENASVCEAPTCSTRRTRARAKKDGAMPKGLEERQTCCVAWMVRPSPAGNPCNSGNEGGGEVQSTSALLSLAAVKADVKEDQGEFEDLKRFGVSDHYGEIDEDHDILGGCMTEFEFK